MPGAPVQSDPTNPNSYPQFGVKINANGTSGTIRQVGNEAAKLSAMNAGYLDWFNSKAAASSALSSQTSGFGSGGQSTVQAAKNAIGSLNPLAPLFQANIWIRVGEVILGLALIIVGLAKLADGTSVGKTAASVAKVASLA